MKFCPCLDLYQGKVRQIVGNTLSDKGNTKINYTSSKDAGWFARLYKKNNLTDCHLIMLGENNEESCKLALKNYPGGFRVGGGINDKNANYWLNQGAKAVIITSFIFSDNNKIDWLKLKNLNKKIGKKQLIIDISAARDNNDIYWIYLEGWKKKSAQQLTESLLYELSNYCNGFIIHSINNEGLSAGIDEKLLKKIKEFNILPVVYGGGVSHIEDINKISKITNGHFDFTVGSALDIFGGTGLSFNDILSI